MVTDATDQVYEATRETDNGTFTANPTNVLLTPPPDLEVESVSAPASGTSGRSLTISYHVANNGNTATPNSSWAESLYLSADRTLDASDLFATSKPHYGSLESQAAYDGSFAYTVPNTLTGTFYAIVVVDPGQAVFEVDRANNQKASATPTTIVASPADLVASGPTGPSRSRRAGRRRSPGRSRTASVRRHDGDLVDGQRDRLGRLGRGQRRRHRAHVRVPWGWWPRGRRTPGARSWRSRSRWSASMPCSSSPTPRTRSTKARTRRTIGETLVSLNVTRQTPDFQVEGGDRGLPDEFQQRRPSPGR